jgi:regulator of sigma E protease
MNILLAFILLSLGNVLGLRIGLLDDAARATARDVKVQILEVGPGTPALAAGLHPADAIVGFRDGHTIVPVVSPEDVQKYAFAHAGKQAIIVVERGGMVQEMPITLRIPTKEAQGPIGISLALTGEVSYPWHEALWRGAQATWQLTMATLDGYRGMLVALVTSGSVASGITGPIGIATLTGQAAQAGISYLIQFVAMISINLAVLNIMPFPALDGGRLALVVWERIRGRALAHRTEQLINAAGFAVLLLLMVAVTMRDVVQFF